MEIGEYDGKISPRLKEFATIFQGTNVEVTISDQIQIERWKKYSWNCAFNIISAITRMRVDQMLDNPKISDLCIRTLKEIVTVAAREGIIFDVEDRIKEAFALARSIGAFKTSTLQDLESGKRIELEAFTGYILKLAKKHKLKVPINETLYSLLSGIVEAK